jgi:hypothetical protein
VGEVAAKDLKFLIQLTRLLKADVPIPLFREKYYWIIPATHN